MTFSMCGMLDVYNSATYASPSFTGQVSPPAALDSFMAINANTGGGQFVYTFNPVKEIFVGVSWDTNSQFQGYSNTNNKVLFIRGGSSGDNSVMVWQGAQDAPKTLKWYQQGSVDNCHISQFKPGSPYCWNSVGPTHDGTGWFDHNINSSACTVAAGSPVKIEIYLKSSLGFATNDGIVRIWCNGTLSSDFTNVNISPNGFTDFQITPTWDGQATASCYNPSTNPFGRDCSREWHHYFDHIHISVPNCPLGCSGGGSSPPPPSPTPPPPPPSSGDYVFQSQFSGAQGGGPWSYRDTDGNLLTYNSSQLKWEGNQLYLAVWGNGFHHGFVSPYRGPVVRWTAHENGTAHITGNAKMYEPGGGATFKIKHNGTEIYSQGMTDQSDHLYDETEVMTAGEYIDFILVKDVANVNNNTMLNPTIAWTTAGSPTPTISGFSPSSGAPGTVVTITGTNFIPSLTGQTVTFSNIAGTVTNATSTSITAVVPSHALTGTIKVTTINGTGTSGSNFTVPLSGVVETVSDVSASALSTTSVTVQFTALSDGTGAAAKHDVRIAAGVISWGDASSVASGT